MIYVRDNEIYFTTPYSMLVELLSHEDLNQIPQPTVTISYCTKGI